MNKARTTSTTVGAVEALMLEKYRNEPFHNLYLLYQKEPLSPEYGGTCSDKTLSFLDTAKQAGFNVSLHSGYIKGKEIHRLAKVHIDGQVFFADVGNGWPALHLYPTDREIDFRCFGMGFRTEIKGQHLTVFHSRNDKESRQLDIDFRSKPENEIRADIAARFRSGITYPFNNSVRFSLVIDNRFLFLRGERLEIYSDSGVKVIQNIDRSRVPDILCEYFRFDIQPILSHPSELSTKKLRKASPVTKV